MTFDVKIEDFVKLCTRQLNGLRQRDDFGSFTAAILNPPYSKVGSNSAVAASLKSVGIEVSNTYAAFIALTSKLLRPGGEMVAIVPRSFCNGPYFKAFRSRFLSEMSLRRIHLIESRSDAFKADAVLQETVILYAVKSAQRPVHVELSSSSGIPSQNDPVVRRRFDEVVSPTDTEQFIHLATNSEQHEVRCKMQTLTGSLSSLGIAVSTGKVVPFRAKEFLVQRTDPSAAPLIHPCHLKNGLVYWPKAKGNKPNGIRIDKETESLLLPAGVYVLIKRFTTKEEPKRLVASVYHPDKVKASKVGFENHLNFLHVEGMGLEATLAVALVAFLNTSMIDSYFRQFNGLTQVNATDLRSLPFPNLSQLKEIAEMLQGPLPAQKDLDRIVSAAIGI